MRTLAIDPLVDYVTATQVDEHDARNALYAPIPYEVRSTGWDRWRGRLRRAARAGRLRIDWAEDYCDILGVHPTEIWGLDYFAACDVEDEPWLGPPEDEPGGRFCGRPTAWRAIGHTRHYGCFEEFGL